MVKATCRSLGDPAVETGLFKSFREIAFDCADAVLHKHHVL